MQPSPLTIGLLMIAFAVVAPALAVGQGAALTPWSGFAAAALVAGGVAMLLRRPLSFAVAMAAGAITAAAGVAGLLLGRPVGLPIKPLVVLVIGLYVCFRVFIARGALAPRPPKRLIADDLADDSAREPR